MDHILTQFFSKGDEEEDEIDFVPLHGTAAPIEEHTLVGASGEYDEEEFEGFEKVPVEAAKKEPTDDLVIKMKDKPSGRLILSFVIDKAPL